MQREIEGLRQNLASIPSGPGDGAQKLKEEYLQKLNMLETQVTPVLFISYTRISQIIFVMHCLFVSLGFCSEEETRCTSSAFEAKAEK